MNSQTKPIHGHRKITIKKQQSPIFSPSPSSSQLDRQHHPHIRRHSVNVNRPSRASYGAEIPMNQQRMTNSNKNQIQAQISQPLSYQSSKQIKSLSKYTINRKNYNYSQNNHNRNSNGSSNIYNGMRNSKNISTKNIYNPSANKGQGMNKKKVEISKKQLCIENYENQKTEKFQKNYPNMVPNFEVLPDFYLIKKQYEIIDMIGKGGFGKVWKVCHKRTKAFYAMKQMSKAIIIAKRSVDSIINQRNLLSELQHEFLVNMHYAFQDNTTLYLIMPLKNNGDMRYHLAKKHKFTQKQCRFIVAVILQVLDYLHSKMIIHRDLKPENIVFDSSGYPNLTDLGIAKYIRQENYQDTSGTPGYMAPQVMFHHNHRYQVDYYALGVIVYELMMGKRPYLGKSRQQIKQLVLKRQAFISKKQIPQEWSIQSADFVNKLLQRKPVKRLGWAGIHELKNHSWLRSFPFEQLKQRKLESPFKERYNCEQVRYRATEFETQFEKLMNKNKQMLAKGNLQDYFDGYTYYQQQTEGLSGQIQCLQFSKSTFLH